MILGFLFLFHFLEVLSRREGFFAKKGGVSLVRNRDLRPTAKANSTIQQALDSLPDRNHVELLACPRSFFSIISSCFGMGISRREVRVLGVWMTTFVCPFPQEIRQTVRLIFSVPSFRSKSPHCKPQISPMRSPNSSPNSKPIFRGVGFACTY